MRTRWVLPLAAIITATVASCARQPPPAHGAGDQQHAAAHGAAAFGTFVASLPAQDYRDYAGRPGTQVRDELAFDQMRDYLIAYYHGARAVATHVVSGTVVDCLVNGGAKDSPPAVAATPGGSSGAAASPAGTCPDGSMPVRRLTLDQMVRFPTLQQYLGKSPGRTGQLPPAR